MNLYCVHLLIYFESNQNSLTKHYHLNTKGYNFEDHLSIAVFLDYLNNIDTTFFYFINLFDFYYSYCI